MLTSLFRQRDGGVLAQRAPRPGGPPHHQGRLSVTGRTMWHCALSLLLGWPLWALAAQTQPPAAQTQPPAAQSKTPAVALLDADDAVQWRGRGGRAGGAGRGTEGGGR